MKAITQRSYGAPADVLRLEEVDPPEVGPGQVLVRVRASSVNPADWFGTTGTPYLMRLMFGPTRPRQPIPGRDVAGTVEAVGPGVTRFVVGDAVFGELSGGAYAELVVADEKLLAAKPTTLDFAEAAAVPLAGGTALQGMRDAARVRPGQDVLVVGASGGVGTFAVQVATALGARVTGVCSTRNVELVRSLGAVDVVDYTAEDFTSRAPTFDVVFDLIGSRPIMASRRVLKPGGVYVASTGKPGGAVLGPIPFLARVLLSAVRRSTRAVVFAAKPSAADLDELTALIDAGRVRPVIDVRVDLASVAAALERQGAGHARGKTVVVV